MELTKQQRSEEKAAPVNGLLFIAFVVILVLASLGLTGCAGTLDKAVATCFALDGGPSYTKAEGVEKFSCERPGVVSTRASR